MKNSEDTAVEIPQGFDSIGWPCPPSHYYRFRLVKLLLLSQRSRRLLRRRRVHLNRLQLLRDANILPAQARAKYKGTQSKSDAEIHNMADSRGVAFERSGKAITLHDLPDRCGACVDDEGRVYADFADSLLQLLAEAVVEDSVGGDEPGRAAYVLTEQGHGHGDGDLGCWNEILDRYERLFDSGY